VLTPPRDDVETDEHDLQHNVAAAGSDTTTVATPLDATPGRLVCQGADETRRALLQTVDNSPPLTSSAPAATGQLGINSAPLHGTNPWLPLRPLFPQFTVRSLCLVDPSCHCSRTNVTHCLADCQLDRSEQLHHCHCLSLTDRLSVLGRVDQSIISALSLIIIVTHYSDPIGNGMCLGCRTVASLNSIQAVTSGPSLQ
jgi:hypothetical protein